MRTLRYFLIFKLCLITISCQTNKKGVSSIVVPDELVSYSLNPFMSSIIPIKCEKVKQLKYAKTTNINDRQVVKKLYQLITDTSNLEVYPNYTLDARSSFEFKRKGVIIKTVCWSLGGLIEIDGKVYKYNQKVEDYLLEQKLIIKIEVPK